MRVAFTVFVLSVSVPMPGLAADPPRELDADALTARIRAEYVAVESAEADYARRRSAGSMASTEAGDYADYIDLLREKVAQDCSDLAASSAEPLPADLPCSKLAITLDPHAAEIDTRTERTATERIDDLDAELNTSLGRFDDLLRREQDRLRAEKPIYTRERPLDSEASADGADGAGGEGGRDSSADAGSGGEAGDAGDGDGAAGQGSAAENSAGENRDASTKTSGSGQAGSPGSPSGSGGGLGGRDGAGGRAGTAGRPSDGTRPEDVGDGNDDDIVARQLREAAELETDPELKEKLWEEYRRYKKGTG